MTLVLNPNSAGIRSPTRSDWPVRPVANTDAERYRPKNSQSLVANVRPVIKAIDRRGLLSGMLQRSFASKAHLLTGAHLYRISLPRCCKRATPHRYPGLVFIGMYIDAIHPRLHNRERRIRGIDFVDF